MDAWLTDARDALANAVGVAPEQLVLDDDTAQELLELARIAAHDSGERMNAPLLAYLLGLAVGRGGDFSAGAEAVRSLP